MQTYKIIYFPFKALAEPIRFLLSYLGEDFEDIRISKDDWPSHKFSMPFGKLPILEMDGKQLHQSTAICRYLGKQAKIVGKNEWEDLQIDMAIDSLHDFRAVLRDYWYEKDDSVKAKKRDVILNETASFFLTRFDEMVKNNNGYIANSKLSWGDLYFIGLSDYLVTLLGYDFFEKYPNLKALKENVTTIPKIAEWIAKRPYSDL